VQLYVRYNLDDIRSGQGGEGLTPVYVNTTVDDMISIIIAYIYIYCDLVYDTVYKRCNFFLSALTDRHKVNITSV